MITAGHSLTMPKLGNSLPAVICSAGPSLALQLPVLKRIQSKCWVIAVGRVLPLLANSGIKVDFAVDIDPVAHLNWPATFEPPSDTVLVAPFSVSPVVAGRFNRFVWFAGESVYFNRIVRAYNQTVPQLAFSGSVTVTALDFAITSGMDQIALLGNDFCLNESHSSHTDGIQLNVSEGEIVEIAGNDSPSVPSVKSLVKLKEALERYLVSTRPVCHPGKCLIHNATRGGAKVAETIRIDLETFVDEYAISPASKHIQDSPAGFTFPPTEETADELSMFLQAGRDICEQQSRFLNHSDHQHEVRQHNSRRMLNLLYQTELELAKTPILSALKNCTVDFEEEVVLESSRPLGPVKDERQRNQLALYKTRLRTGMARDLTMGFNADGATNGSMLSDPQCYQTFREVAIDFVRRSNGPYADLLERDEFEPASPYQFDLSPRSGRFLPFTSVIERTGKKTALNSSNETMEVNARNEVLAFLKAQAFDPEAHGVVFAAPGNWLHVVAFAETYPQAKLLVIDPWPTLFSQLISYSLFIHTMPEDAVITALHPLLDNALSLSKTVLSRWHQQQRTTLVFRHPVAWQLPDIPATFSSLGLLV